VLFRSWVLNGGGRYDRMTLDNTPEGADRLESTFDAFSPKLGATFKLLEASAAAHPALNLYGAYSHAFLPPRRPSSLTPATVTLNLRPEDIDNVEGGVKGSALDARLSFEASYFWMKESGVVLSRRQGPFFFPTNAGEQRYKGIEMGTALSVGSLYSMFVNAAFYRNRFGTFVIQTQDGDEVLTGNRLPISPNYVISWGGMFNPGRSIEATFTLKHLSNVVADRENTFTIDPYTLVDAAATWRRGALRVTLAGHNLFNKEYYWNADGETADPGRPRQVILTTSVRLH